MSSQRSKLPAVRLSKTEERAFALLFLNGEKRTTATLTRRFYGGDKKTPFNGRLIVAGIFRALEKKSRLMGGIFVPLTGQRYFVCRSKRRGPHPTEVWTVMKGQRT